MKKRFSMKNKLLIIFGVLIAVAAIIEGLLAVQTARTAVTEKIESHLKDKATDTAEIIDGKISAMFQFLEGIARMPIFREQTAACQDKAAALQKEVISNKNLHEAALATKDGYLLSTDGKSIPIHGEEWYKIAVQGKRVLSEPMISVTDGKLILTFAIPIYNNEREVSGVLGAVVLAEWLSEQINDIVVGETGECYILGLEGTAAAHKNFEIVRNRQNAIEFAKKDKTFNSLATFTQHALESNESEISYYDYKGATFIALHAAIKTTKWTVIIRKSNTKTWDLYSKNRLF